MKNLQDDPEIRKVAEDEFRDLIEKITNILESVDGPVPAGDDRLKKLYRYYHTLKSASEFTGFEKTYKMALLLELFFKKAEELGLEWDENRKDLMFEAIMICKQILIEGLEVDTKDILLKLNNF